MARIHRVLFSRLKPVHFKCSNWPPFGLENGSRTAGPWQRWGDVFSATCSSRSVRGCKCPPLYWDPQTKGSNPTALCLSCHQTRTAPGPEERETLIWKWAKGKKLRTASKDLRYVWGAGVSLVLIMNGEKYIKGWKSCRKFSMEEKSLKFDKQAEHWWRTRALNLLHSHL